MSNYWFHNVPALGWEQPSTTQTTTDNRRKIVRVSSEIAKKHIENAVKEALKVNHLPENTVIEGSLYQSGGSITLYNPEFPASPDGKAQDITPKKV